MTENLYKTYFFLLAFNTQ